MLYYIYTAVVIFGDGALLKLFPKLKKLIYQLIKKNIAVRSMKRYHIAQKFNHARIYNSHTLGLTGELLIKFTNAWLYWLIIH